MYIDEDRLNRLINKGIGIALRKRQERASRFYDEFAHLGMSDEAKEPSRKFMRMLGEAHTRKENKRRLKDTLFLKVP